MPYIKQHARDYYFKQGSLKDLSTALNVIKLEAAKGDLNYIVTYLVKRWLDKNGRSYFKTSTMIDALQNAADELKRKELAGYEDKKEKENGEV